MPEVTLARGLSEVEANERLAVDGPNELPSAKQRNIFEQALAVIKQPMLLLLLIAGAINFALSEPLDGAILLVFVLVVIGISIYQEHKSENALAALRELSAPMALVLRDGVQRKIASRELVVGDVVLISEGDRIPADGILISGTHLQVDESNLTGESMSVQKTVTQSHLSMQRPGGDGTAFLFSSTMAVKGRGSMLVLAAGLKTEIGQIGSALKEIKTENTPLQREINRLVKIIAAISVVAAVSVTVIYGLTRQDWLVGLLAGIATAMGMLPEEFPVVLTVFMALGAWRLSKVHVLARRSAVIETLGSATVVCVDKTGTITQNRMDVKQFVVGGRVIEVTETVNPELADIVGATYLASSPEPFDPMDKAFRALGEKYSPAEVELVKEFPISTELLAVVQVWRGASGELTVAAKGAPETIASLCKLASDERQKLETQIEQATDLGLRVLGVASATWQGELPSEVTKFDFKLDGLACLQDPVRDGVPAAIAEASNAGVRTVMITGDYPGTAMAIAREIGLDVTAGHLTGKQLAELSDAELTERIKTVNVFARMVPEQKLQLIRALKANGEVVAMTGDGVNDAPALRAADIGIAMGARGTDVAREAASLVLTDDNFTSIVAGIKNGRTIFENMRKALTYVIAVHVPILGMTLIPVFGPSWPLILVPVLIAFLELIIDPACSVVFEAEASAADVMKRKPRALGETLFERRVLLRALLQGAAGLIGVVGVFLFGLAQGLADDQVRTMAFVTMVLTNLLLILVNRSTKLTAFGTLLTQKNPAVKWILAGATLLLILVTNLPPLRDAFSLGQISVYEWLAAIGAALLSAIGFELNKVLAR